MGIQGLLPLLKEAQRGDHIRNYKGKTLAVDGYVWLHRGAYACSQNLALGKQDLRYIKYVMDKIHMLLHYGVTPYVVFDGGLLLSKKGTELERARHRQGSLAIAKKALREGNKTLARESFSKAVDVTPIMAFELIKVLRQHRIKYLVAPFEADAQLVFLEKEGLCHGIITEDSDLLVFGSNLALYKMDNYGTCVSISRGDLAKCAATHLSSWSETKFRHMAILSGCDYLKSISGIGIKTAMKLIRQYRTIERITCVCRRDFPDNYLHRFYQADFTFLHQKVFDPRNQKLVHLNPLPSVFNDTFLKFTGEALSNEIASGIALGDVNPITLRPFSRVEELVGTFRTMDSYFVKLPQPSTPESLALPEPEPTSLVALDANMSARVSDTPPLTTSKYFKDDTSTRLSRIKVSLELDISTASAEMQHVLELGNDTYWSEVSENDDNETTRPKSGISSHNINVGSDSTLFSTPRKRKCNGTVPEQEGLISSPMSPQPIHKKPKWDHSSTSCDTIEGETFLSRATVAKGWKNKFMPSSKVSTSSEIPQQIRTTLKFGRTNIEQCPRHTLSFNLESFRYQS